MRRVELTVPVSLLEDLGILSARFFRHNQSVEVLQSLSLRPQVAALFVRVRRRGRFKDPQAVRREARQIVQRYRLERFEVLSADPRRREYVAWVEWRLPPALRARLGEFGAAVVPLGLASTGRRDVRASLLASDAALPRLRELLDGLGAPYRVRAVRSTTTATLQPLAALTTRQRDLLQLAFRMGYYDTPSKTSLERIAGLVGITRAGLSKHLRKAERRLLAVALGRA